MIFGYIKRRARHVADSTRHRARSTSSSQLVIDECGFPLSAVVRFRLLPRAASGGKSSFVHSADLCRGAVRVRVSRVTRVRVRGS